MINTAITNHLKNLGFTQEWYRDQAAWELLSEVSDLSFIYYVNDDRFEVFNKTGAPYGDDDTWVLTEPEGIQEIINMIDRAEMKEKAEFKMGYTISESSRLFKYLRFLEKSYIDITLIGKDNGCPVFWMTIFLTLFLPIMYMVLLPIRVWFINSIEELMNGDNKKAIGYFLFGGVWFCTIFPIFLGWFVSIIIFLTGPGETPFILSEIWAVCFILLGIIIALIAIIVTGVYTIGLLASWNNKRMEKKQLKLNKLRNENTEFKTTGEFISTAAIGFYEKHCPKLNWKYNDREDKD